MKGRTLLMIPGPIEVEPEVMAARAALHEMRIRKAQQPTAPCCRPAGSGRVTILRRR